MGFAQKELSMDITSPQGRLSDGHLKRVAGLGHTMASTAW